MVLTLALLFNTYSVQFDLPPDLLAAVCYVESTHNTTAIHHDDGGSDSIGICQVKLETARWLGFQGTARDLLDPVVNVYYAAKILRYQLSRYKSVSRALVAYNKGNARGYISSKYSDKVIAQWKRGQKYESRRLWSTSTGRR